MRFRIPLLPADLTAFCFHFFPLQLKRLLGLGADSAFRRLFSGISEPPLWIVRHFPRSCFYSRAEDQFVIMLQYEFKHVVIPGFRTKGYLAGRQFSFVNPLKNTDSERVFKVYRQACFHGSLSIRPKTASDLLCETSARRLPLQ